MSWRRKRQRWQPADAKEAVAKRAAAKMAAAKMAAATAPPMVVMAAIEPTMLRSSKSNVGQQSVGCRCRRAAAGDGIHTHLVAVRNAP